MQWWAIRNAEMANVEMWARAQGRNGQCGNGEMVKVRKGEKGKRQTVKIVNGENYKCGKCAKQCENEMKKKRNEEI